MSQRNKKSSRIPGEFKRYFWDVDFSGLDIEKYPGFIAERIMNYGDLKGIKWLLSWADRDFIKDLAVNSRNLNAKTRNYWQVLLLF